MDTSRLIYLHGLESTSNIGKARLFREWFPGMLTPDFTGSFDERMTQFLQAFLTEGGTSGIIFTILFLIGVIVQGSVLRSKQQ